VSLNQKPVLAVIPARGGSKGLRGKNMREVNEIPLVGYTINSALNSKYIDEVYLTSDDELALKYAETFGVQGICRPDKFSNDIASANGVVEHFISTLPKELADKNPYIIYLQPTSPLRTAVHIDDALKGMVAAGLDRLISVAKMEKSPFKAFILDDQDRLQALFAEGSSNKRRQDLPAVFMPNGAIYVFELSAFTERSSFPSNGSYAYVMSDDESLDIDSESDLDLFRQALGQNIIIQI